MRPGRPFPIFDETTGHSEPVPAPLAWHTLWTFRAEDGLDVCKGNQVADGPAGENVSCPVFETHARLRLRPERVSEAA